jgi:preprotein translocase subunit Sec63
MENRILKGKDKKDKKTKTRTKEDTSQELNNKFSNAFVEIKNNAWNFSIIIFIVFMAVMCVYLQYQNSKSRRTSVIAEESELNYYEILGVAPNSDLATIRKRYKEMTKMWHPDKNPGCKTCHEKFMHISKAHEILTDEAKKGDFDAKGGKSIFSSKPVILNEKNYHHLVEASNDFWVIMIYENTRGNNHNKHMADVWDEVASKYSHIVKFGVIDVLLNENLLHFLPFKFQYYPNIVTYLHGEGSELFNNIESYSVKSKKKI